MQNLVDSLIFIMVIDFFFLIFLNIIKIKAYTKIKILLLRNKFFSKVVIFKILFKLLEKFQF